MKKVLLGFVIILSMNLISYSNLSAFTFSEVDKLMMQKNDPDNSASNYLRGLYNGIITSEQINLTFLGKKSICLPDDLNGDEIIPSIIIKLVQVRNFLIDDFREKKGKDSRKADEDQFEDLGRLMWQTLFFEYPCDEALIERN